MLQVLLASSPHQALKPHSLGVLQPGQHRPLSPPWSSHDRLLLSHCCQVAQICWWKYWKILQILEITENTEKCWKILPGLHVGICYSLIVTKLHRSAGQGSLNVLKIEFFIKADFGILIFLKVCITDHFTKIKFWKFILPKLDSWSLGK